MTSSTELLPGIAGVTGRFGRGRHVAAAAWPRFVQITTTDKSGRHATRLRPAHSKESLMLSTLSPSLIRTVVPIIVGALISWGVTDWTGVDEAGLTVLVTGLVTAAYYALARVFETYVSPHFGLLLGLAKQPAQYAKVGTDGALDVTSLPEDPH